MAIPNLDELANLPIDADGPVFKEPWEARAFALALRLQEHGVFTWTEWAEELGKAINNAQIAGDKDLGDTYYQHWLACLETLVTRKGITTPAMLAAQKQSAHEAHQQLHAALGHHTHS